MGFTHVKVPLHIHLFLQGFEKPDCHHEPRWLLSSCHSGPEGAACNIREARMCTCMSCTCWRRKTFGKNAFVTGHLCDNPSHCSHYLSQGAHVKMLHTCPCVLSCQVCTVSFGWIRAVVQTARSTMNQLGVTFDKQHPVFTALEGWWYLLSLAFKELVFTLLEATERHRVKKTSKCGIYSSFIVYFHSSSCAVYRIL